MKTKEILSALERVKPGLGTDDFAQTNYFAFAKGRVFTYNDELSVSHPIEDLDVEGSIRSDEMFKFLNKVNREDVSLKHQGENELVLKAGRSKAKFYIKEIATSPEEIFNIKEKDWHPLPTGLIEGIEFVKQSAGKDQLRPILTCVHINKAGFVEASDGYRIANYTLDEKPNATVLIPVKLVNHVLKIKPTEWVVREDWAYFRNDEGTQIACRILEDDQFPNTKEFLESAKEGDSIEFPKETKTILSKASVFAKSGEANMAEPLVNVRLKRGTMIISSRCDGGEFEEKIKTSSDGEVEFYIRPYLLQDILSETVECSVGDNMLRFEGDKWVYVSTLANEEG